MSVLVASALSLAAASTVSASADHASGAAIGATHVASQDHQADAGDASAAEDAEGDEDAAATRCGRAITAAEDDYERLAETARHACKAEMEALADAAERERGAPRRNLSPERWDCDALRERLSRPAPSRPFAICAAEPDAAQHDETRPTTGASPDTRDGTDSTLRRSDAPLPVDIARARRALSSD